MRAQVAGGPRQNAVDTSKALVTSDQGHGRLCEIFPRQLVHTRGRYIRRIADDEVIDASIGWKQIGFVQAHTRLQAMARAIDGGHRQRSGAEIGGIDLGVRKSQRTGQRDAATAGADVENTFDLSGLKPRCELRVDEFGERRARHQHALVDVELMPGKPHALSEIGGRAAPFESRCYQVLGMGTTGVLHGSVK